jgi:hypothetical protein
MERSTCTYTGWEGRISRVSTKVSSEKTYRVADHLRSAKFHEPPGSLVEVEHGHGVRQGAEIHLRQAAATDSELDGAVKIRHGGVFS